MTGGGQTGQKECVECVHLGVALVGTQRAPFGQQIHVEIDDFVVQPIQTGQCLDVAPSNGHTELGDERFLIGMGAHFVGDKRSLFVGERREVVVLFDRFGFVVENDNR